MNQLLYPYSLKLKEKSKENALIAETTEESDEEENKVTVTLQEIPSLETRVGRQPYDLRIMIPQHWIRHPHSFALVRGVQGMGERRGRCCLRG